MKKLILFAPAVLLGSFLVSSCTKEKNKVFNTNFYTTAANTRMFLYIDEVYQGELSYFQNKPECGASSSDGPKALNMQLNSGEYKVTARNAQGNVLAASSIELSASGMRSTGNVGGITMEDNGSCLTVGLSE